MCPCVARLCLDGTLLTKDYTPYSLQHHEYALRQFIAWAEAITTRVVRRYPAEGYIYKLSRQPGHENIRATERYLPAFQERDARKRGSVLDRHDKGMR